MNEKSLFHEEQRFKQPLIWLALIGMEVALIVFIVLPMIQIWVLGETVDGISPSNIGMLFFFATILVIENLVVLMIFTLRLITDVRPDGVYVQFSPLHRKPKFYAAPDILSFEAITYRPIRDYGGWGIRYGRNGRAFNVQGNQGILFEFSDGKRLLIGTQHPEEFEAALRLLPRSTNYPIA